MKFQISNHELEQRRKRILYGVVFSIALAGMVSHQHFNNPDTYNNVLYWSVVGFVGLANLVNYYRHRKYLKRVRGHSIELLEGSLRFNTADDVSELKLEDVVAMRVFNRGDSPGHIQLKLKNGRGIRLEGYGNMEELVEELKRELPGKQMLSH